MNVQKYFLAVSAYGVIDNTLVYSIVVSTDVTNDVALSTSQYTSSIFAYFEPNIAAIGFTLSLCIAAKCNRVSLKCICWCLKNISKTWFHYKKK